MISTSNSDSQAQKAPGYKTTYTEPLPEDRSQALKTIWKDYRSHLDPDNFPSPGKIAGDITCMVKQAFSARNSSEPEAARWDIPETLPMELVADVMLYVHEIRNIKHTGEKGAKQSSLGFYQTDAGIYITGEAAIRNLVREYNNSLYLDDVKEIISRLEDEAETTECCNSGSMAAFHNGVLNYATKEFCPFSPDLVFTDKYSMDCMVRDDDIIIRNNDAGTEQELEAFLKSGWRSDDDLVLEFKNYILQSTSLICIPGKLLLEFYRHWMQQNHPDKTPYERNGFYKSFANQLNPAEDGWFYTGKKGKRMTNDMPRIEPLLEQYNLTEWMENPNGGKDGSGRVTLKKFKNSIRGFSR